MHSDGLGRLVIVSERIRLVFSNSIDDICLFMFNSHQAVGFRFTIQQATNISNLKLLTIYTVFCTNFFICTRFC